MNPGSEVRIKDKATGEKLYGIVTAVNIQNNPVEVTLGGLFPGGPPPDDYRKFVPGRSSMTITIEVEL